MQAKMAYFQDGADLLHTRHCGYVGAIHMRDEVPNVDLARPLGLHGPLNISLCASHLK